MTATHVLTEPDRRILALVCAGLLAVGAVGCGSDDEATTDDDRAAYCRDVIVLDQMFQNFDAEDATGFEAALAASEPVMDRVVAAAPEQLADEYTVVSTAFGEVVDTGNPEPFFTPEVDAANDAVHADNVASCGWTVAEITGEDFKFTGTFPSEPGPVSFDFVNTGAEAHALIVARKLDDVAGSALDAFNALESEEAFATAFEQTASVFAEPGDAAYGLADLEPGEYLAFCPVPSGTAGEASIGDGPPHFVHGMVTEFTVPGA